MAGLPKNFPGDLFVGVIAGGDITDPPQDHSSNQRVLSPWEHGPDVNIEDLNFSSLMHSPTGFSQQWFHGALDPGTVVFGSKTLGQNQVQIFGQANDVQNGGQGQGGGMLMGGHVAELQKRSIKINTPPQIKEAESRGAKVRIISEKGKQHSRSLLEGLPSHGALFDMAGWRMPQVQNVPTAKQDYSSIQTNDMLGALGGELMSMGGMMQGLMSSFGSTMGAGGGGGAGGGVGGGAQNISSGSYTDYKGQIATSKSSLTKANANTSIYSAVPYYDGVTTVPTINVTTTTPNVDATVTASNAVINTANTSATRNANSFTVTTSYDGDPGKLGTGYLRHVGLFDLAYGYDPALVSRVANTGFVLSSGSASNTLTNFDGSYADYYGANSDITRMDIILNSIPNNMKLAINNLSILVQGVEGSNILNHSTSNRVHLETYLDNACDLLSQVTCMADLMSALKRLQYDQSLFGLEKIPDAVVPVQTAWGNTTANVAPTGAVTINYTAAQKAAMNTQYTLMTSPTTSPSPVGLSNANSTNATTSTASSGGSSGGGGSGGGSGGGGGGGSNMFGQSAGTMMDMFKRMAPQAEQSANKLMQTVSQGQDFTKLWKVAQTTLQGGNPISDNLIKF